MKYPDAKRLVRRCRKIRGLTCLESTYLLAMLDEIQRNHKVEGNLFEIGIYHGRVLATLCGMKTEQEKVVCCEPNERFLKSSQKTISGMFGPDAVRYLNSSSFDLSAEQLEGNCRIIRIDGLHTAEAVINDLSLSMSALAAGGAIIIDDVFNENCPGVAEGLIEFHRQNPDPIPVVQGFGQTVLVRQADADMYRLWFSNGEWKQFFSSRRYPVQTRTFLGQPVLLFLRNHIRMAAFRAFGGWLF